MHPIMINTPHIRLATHTCTNRIRQQFCYLVLGNPPHKACSNMPYFYFLLIIGQLFPHCSHVVDYLNGTLIILMRWCSLHLFSISQNYRTLSPFRAKHCVTRTPNHHLSSYQPMFRICLISHNPITMSRSPARSQTHRHHTHTNISTTLFPLLFSYFVVNHVICAKKKRMY